MTPEHLLTYITSRNGPRHEQQATTSSVPPSVGVGNSITSSLSLSQLTPLPTWENVLAIAELYLLYCDAQPLPLFHRDSFLGSLGNRDPEVIYAMLALSVRFAEDQYLDANDLAARINGYTEVARSLVMKRVSEGPVELSTLQCLCLLSLVDFTSKTIIFLGNCIICAKLNSRRKYASLEHSQQPSYESSAVCKPRVGISCGTFAGGPRGAQTMFLEHLPSQASARYGIRRPGSP
jgi:hypothetical protein